MKKRTIVVCLLALCIVSGVCIFFASESGIRAVAKIKEKKEQKNSREEYLDLLAQDRRVQDYIAFRQKYDPDYNPSFAPNGADYSSLNLEDYPDRDKVYAEVYKGTYVADELSKLSGIKKYSSESLLFNSKIDTFRLGLDSSVYEYQDAGESGIVTLLQECPADVMRERADGTRYLVYDTDEGYRLFLMMSPDSPDPFTVGYPVLYKNKLSYNDFAGICPGDSIAKVSAIDDVCELYCKTWFDFMNVSETGFEKRGEKYDCFSTIHYLSDGLLKIEYDSINANGEPIVKSVSYYPDYIMKTFTDKELNYRINDLDLL